jgi:uncharacterized OsmC-like protein
VKGVNGLEPVKVFLTSEGKLKAVSGEHEFEMVKGFGPSELLEVSLGACIAILVATFSMRHRIDMRGMSVSISMEKEEEPPRVGKIHIHLQVPSGASEAQLQAIERVSHHCFIHNTLLNSPEIDLQMETIPEEVAVG